MLHIALLKIICIDSTEALSNLRSTGLNHHLPQQVFVTNRYCAEGI